MKKKFKPRQKIFFIFNNIVVSGNIISETLGKQSYNIKANDGSLHYCLKCDVYLNESKAKKTLLSLYLNKIKEAKKVIDFCEKQISTQGLSTK